MRARKVLWWVARRTALASTAQICTALTQVHILVHEELLCYPFLVLWPYCAYIKGMGDDAWGLQLMQAKATSLH